MTLKSTSNSKAVNYIMFCFLFCPSVLPLSAVQCYQRNLLPPAVNIYAICTLS